MSENFIPLLATTDWNEEWKELQKARRNADDAGYWDGRATTFGRKDAPSSYADAFIERAGIKPFESVLDMGCGTGALSVPLGMRNHKVIAADFSPGMLAVLQKSLDEHKLSCVTTKLMSWEDDWRAHGLSDGSVDVALASRSIATSDLKRSLMLLDSVAKRRVCITVTPGSSPRLDERIMKGIGLAPLPGYDFQYAFNILVNEGIKPEVSYIESVRKESYDSVEEAFQDYSPMVYDTAKGIGETERAQALERLRSWLEAHLVENLAVAGCDKGGFAPKKFSLDRPRITTWAFIAWDK